MLILAIQWNSVLRWQTFQMCSTVYLLFLTKTCFRWPIPDDFLALDRTGLEGFMGLTHQRWCDILLSSLVNILLHYTLSASASISVSELCHLAWRHIMIERLGLKVQTSNEFWFIRILQPTTIAALTILKLRNLYCISRTSGLYSHFRSLCPSSKSIL